MPGNIFGTRAVFYDKPAWHHLGYVINVRSTAEQQIVPAGLDYELRLSQLFAHIDQNTSYAMDDRAIMRAPTTDDPTWRSFGIVGDQYELLQNVEVARLGDMITHETDWQLETMGALGKGETLFITYKNPTTFSIGNEDYQNYFFLLDQRNGLASLRLMVTTTRVVCQNTVNIALRNLKAEYSVRHNKGLFAETAWRMELVNSAIKRGDDIAKALQSLVAVEFNKDQFDDLLVELFPLPKKPKAIEFAASGKTQLIERAERAQQMYDSQLRTIANNKLQIEWNYLQLRQTAPMIANTGMHAFQAITEFITHQAPARNETFRAEKDLFGNGTELRTRAYELILR